jgi:hypothetical protein
MRTPVIVLLGSAVCLVAVTTIVMAAQKRGRSYEECRQLAISRGWTKPSLHASARYQRREAAGLKTNPTGFMGLCMAGIQG